ncbi:MAG TPA: hypothetical protein VFW94_02760, partial [Candidatus Acidoferrales bacterium]|nr:hypothetical protein [Candidatus Acidoferrales bacterium]
MNARCRNGSQQGRRPRHDRFCWLALVSAMVLLAQAAFAVPAPSRVVVDGVGRRVKIPAHVDRIVSLAPNLTETLYALGLGDRVVGDTT